MKKYDVIVIGSGCGTIIADEASSHGMKVALIDKGPLGGTCLNVGCIPSKMLIYPADIVVEIQKAVRLGINARIIDIDFNYIMERMRKSINESRDYIREGIKSTENLDFYEGETHFIRDYLLQINREEITAEKIFIASGSRPFIPPVKGLESVDYLTNESLLSLNEKPESLIIIGGGYIAVEYGHFFSAMGTNVTMIEMADRLVLAEEPEISELLKNELSKRMNINTSTEVIEVKKKDNNIVVTGKNSLNGNLNEYIAQKILIAVGRRSNADLLKVQNSGIEIDKRGFIIVDDYLETTKKNIYAAGDANGQQMFTHVANMEATIAAQNLIHSEKRKVDYTVMPHAIYTHPQIASVGLTEESARKKYDAIVSKTKYFDVAKGEAMMENEGFAKAIIDKKSRKILGFHIIGPYAPELIQEVVNAMTSGGHMEEIFSSIHIHPCLSELIPASLSSAG